MAFSPSSKARLTRHDVARFAGSSLFDRLARAVCSAGCLPRKELYESWETGRRVRRRFRGGRIVDLGGGHGLLAHVMLLLDDSSPNAVVVDPAPPPSAATIARVLIETWPRLAGRVTFDATRLDDVTIDVNDLVVSCHACGALTDRVISRAADAGARVAVVPCCHDLARAGASELSGWVDGALAMDIERAVRLRARGYDVWTQAIPAAITPKNRLLMGQPASR